MTPSKYKEYNDSMRYNDIEFEAIVATPGCGKSYLCDKYPDRFVDVDELRLRCKYDIPENITRAELEATKGDRPYPRRANHTQYIKDMYARLDELIAEGKTLIAAPHPEAIDYLVENNIRFCFVYADESMREELVRRFESRGNSQELIKSNDDMFETFLESNRKESKSVVHYAFKKDEYLEDILVKFGYKF